MQFCADVLNSIILQPSPLKMKVIATWAKVERGLSLADALCLSPCKTICIIFSQENESHQQIHPPRKEILAISSAQADPLGVSHCLFAPTSPPPSLPNSKECCPWEIQFYPFCCISSAFQHLVRTRTLSSCSCFFICLHIYTDIKLYQNYKWMGEGGGGWR